jgi:hypothetical protein
MSSQVVEFLKHLPQIHHGVDADEAVDGTNCPHTASWKTTERVSTSDRRSRRNGRRAIKTTIARY